MTQTRHELANLCRQFVLKNKSNPTYLTYIIFHKMKEVLTRKMTGSQQNKRAQVELEHLSIVEWTF